MIETAEDRSRQQIRTASRTPTALLWLVSSLSMAGVLHAQGIAAGAGRMPSLHSAEAPPADMIAATLEAPVGALVEEVLERNPDLGRARANADAAAFRAPQVRPLPDPIASVTAFLATPETRVGPQQAAATISQRIPWFGKLTLREQEAFHRATAAAAQVEAMRLALVTSTRRLYFELAFLASQEQEVRSDRATLVHYEGLARARYASGVGLEQAVLKIQAEITKDDNRLLDIGNRRATLVASVNALRDRPATTALPEPTLPRPSELPDIVLEPATRIAHEVRPEVAEARALIAAASVAVELAGREDRPDLTLGLAYTLVGRREDAAGRANPPEGDGDDIVGLTMGVNLPVRSEKLAAGVQEAVRRGSAAEEQLRSTLAAIDESLGNLVERIPLTRRQLSLFEELLTLQAEEALRSAEAAYAAGLLGALDLLDAERVLLEVRIAAARSLADYLVALARLEGATGVPLTALLPGYAP